MRSLFLSILLLLALPAGAQPIPGASDPAFLAARESWLAGDDLPALEGLAALARDDNTAAQMMLSQLALATWSHAAVTEDMPRQERIALLRQDGGLSGRDWMQTAAEVHPLAAAYWESRFRVGDDLRIFENARTFLTFGDRRAAYLAISEVINDYQLLERAGNAIHMLNFFGNRLGRPAQWLRAAAEHATAFRGPVGTPLRIPDGVRTRDEFEAYIDEMRSPEVAFAAQGALIIRNQFRPQPFMPFSSPSWNALKSYEHTLRRLIASDPDAAPIADFCSETCPEAFDDCLVSLAEASSYGDNFPYPFASPAPEFVSDQDYQRSGRFFSDILARVSVWTQGSVGVPPWPGCSP